MSITQRQKSAYSLVGKGYSYLQVGSLMGITAQGAWKLTQKAETKVRGGLIALDNTEGVPHPGHAIQTNPYWLDQKIGIKSVAWIADPYTMLEWAIDTKIANYSCCGKKVDKHRESFWCDMCGRWSDGEDLYTGYLDPAIMREFW